MPCEFEANEKLLPQVPSGATVPWTFHKAFYCLLPTNSFDILQNEFLESNMLKVEVLIKLYLFNRKVNYFHLRLVAPLKSAQGFSNSATVMGGVGMINFVRGRHYFMGCWEPEDECFWPFKSFPKLKTTICKHWTLIKIKIGMTCVCKEYEG